jgi:hypothetical protein
VTEEQLSQLSLDDKLKVTQYLVADIAASLVSDDHSVVTKARHDLGAVVMTLTNLHQLATSAKPGDTKVIASIHKRFRYQGEADV